MDTIVVREAETLETEAVAELRWRWHSERGGDPVVRREGFVAAVVAFVAGNARTHHCVVAVRDGIVIGVAWLAVLPRVPSPGAIERASGDVQCVYVVPEERNASVGSSLMDAVLAKARQLGLEHVTVHSSAEAISLYERNGFAASARFLSADFAGR